MRRTYLRGGAVATAALIVAGLATMVLAAPATAAPAQLADSVVWAGGVDLQPNVEFSRATLTVSGNGRVYQRDFEAGDRLSIGMFDPDGQPLADGIYRWQLQLTPDAEAARALRRAASMAGGRPTEAWDALVGSFAIRDGAIADPFLTEAEPVRVQAGLRSALPASGFGASRGPAEDDDSAVGSGGNVEARVNADAARRAPLAGSGPRIEAGGVVGQDTDSVSQALGQSLEPVNQTSAQSRQAPAPRPRSDGSNGRPRS